jgi:acetyltransferase-like isoleucine patch superfamily enzyme
MDWTKFNHLPRTIIGDCSIVAAGSVVTKEVPSMCIAGGDPARVLKRD